MKFFLYVLIFLVVFGGVWKVSAKKLPCPVWLRWIVELDNPFTKTNRAAEIISLLELKEDMHVLDAGCGPGRLTIPLSQKVTKMTALDIQAGMLSRVKEKAKTDNIEYLQAGLGDGMLPVGKYDRIVLVTVLGEILDPDKALKEIYTALKPEGILSITEVIFDPHFQRKPTVLSMAESVGFKEKAFYGNRIAFTMHLCK